MKFPGFTLLETLIAIAVLLTAIVIPFNTIEQALLSTYTARDNLTAASLAQEGIEFVRSIRDGNYIKNRACVLATGSDCRDFLSDMDGTAGGLGDTANCFPASGGGSCAVDAYSPAVIECKNANCSDEPLYMTSDDWYTLTTIGTTQTKFYRYVQLKWVGTHTEVQVLVTVWWKTNGGTIHQVQLTDYLDDWLTQ